MRIAMRCALALGLAATLAGCGDDDAYPAPTADAVRRDGAAAHARADTDATRAGGDAARPSAGALDPALRFRRVSVHDPGIGCEAFSLLVPRGWSLEGGIRWQMQYANLATGAFVVREPDGRGALEAFPIVPACWDPSGTVGFFFGRGDVYMGSVVEPPPADAAAYVREVFVPTHRPGARVVEAPPLPDVARTVEQAIREPGVDKRVTATRTRLAYDDRGTPMLEDVFVTLVRSRSPMLPGLTMWTLEHQYSFRAEADRLDELAPLLQASIASARPSLAWFAGYAQVVQLWQQGQMQAIRSAGELSRRISANDDAILESMRASWSERQASQDRTSREFSEYVRGVETYDQPFEGRELQLPSGYEDAWVSAGGEVVLSNDPGFDPNVGATHEWRRMRPTR